MQVILSWQLLHCEGQVEPDGEVPGQADETTMTRSINSASLRGIINIFNFRFIMPMVIIYLNYLPIYYKEFHICIFFFPSWQIYLSEVKYHQHLIFILVFHDQIAPQVAQLTF